MAESGDTISFLIMALMKFLPEAGLLMPMAVAVFFMGSENHLNIKNPFCSDNKISGCLSIIRWISFTACAASVSLT